MKNKVFIEKIELIRITNTKLIKLRHIRYDQKSTISNKFYQVIDREAMPRRNGIVAVP